MLDAFKIGCFEDEGVGTGVTVILARAGATAGVSVRGKAPATRETDLLRTENTVDKINAVVFSGGSAFGLDACSGVMQYLHKKGLGFPAGAYRVPIVCGASLYDLEYKTFGFPNADMGQIACEYAHGFTEMNGSIGAGAGATVGKLFGMKCASKSGLGVSCIKIGGVEMAAVVAVNAFGNVCDPKTGEILKGAQKNGSYVDIEALLKSGVEAPISAFGGNTTIGCVVTNAKLTKSECNRLADATHDAYARCIRPVHTDVDGDTIFVMSSGEAEANSLGLQALATDLMVRAILAATRE